MGLTSYPHGIQVCGAPFYGMTDADVRGANGSVFFCEGNKGSDSNDGKTWDTAFATVAAGLAACHEYQSTSGNRAWAKRSTLHICGDSFEEDLVKFAEKTDVVGWGQCDGFYTARIKGNHVFPSTSYAGCRFWNVTFQDNDATGTIMTVPTAQSGIQFNNCVFMTGTATVVGILMTASADFVVRNCKFFGSWVSSFSTAAISIAAGNSNRCFIEGNTISQQHATGVGILVNASRTGADSFIRYNNLYTTAMAIDENSDTFAVIGNRIITGANAAAGTSVDIPDLLSVDNIVTGGDGNTISIPTCNFGAQS